MKYGDYKKNPSGVQIARELDKRNYQKYEVSAEKIETVYNDIIDEMDKYEIADRVYTDYGIIEYPPEYYKLPAKYKKEVNRKVKIELERRFNPDYHDYIAGLDAPDAGPEEKKTMKKKISIKPKTGTIKKIDIKFNPKKSKKNPSARALRFFQDFQGRPVTGSKTIELNDMKELVYLGEAVAIEYATFKPHLDNDPETYRHEFEKPCELFSNGKELIIYGKSIKINKAGIHG
jgi:hypothetical protein